jgi:hypothetical protein
MDQWLQERTTRLQRESIKSLLDEAGWSCVVLVEKKKD